MEKTLSCDAPAQPAYDLSLWRRHPLFALRRQHWFQVLSRRLDYTVPLFVRDIKFRVYLRAMSHLSILLGQRWEENEHEFVKRFIAHTGAGIFWDVGANVGLYSFLFLSLNPAGTAYLFEPDERNVDCLQRTIRHPLLRRRAFVFPVAVAEAAGVTQFWEDSLTGSTGSIEGTAEDCFIHHHHGIRPARKEVPTVTLDEMWKSHATPQLIKIDVEGAEERVLKGARQLLAEAQPALLVEMSCPRRAQLIEGLRQYGYRVVDADTLSWELVESRNVIALPRRIAVNFLSGKCA